ncbi:MAG TPA: hypothetical protein VFC46_00545, partial [Humisphaera sp.]|nr:hypothetical protein [Humisphaera sp.]
MQNSADSPAHRSCTPSTAFAVPSPHYSWRLLRAGPLLLDGGSMFGVVPKVVWSRSVACDEQNRIRVGYNCLLLE